MPKLVYKMIFDKFTTFSIFGLLFVKGIDDQGRDDETKFIMMNKSGMTEKAFWKLSGSCAIGPP